MNSQEMKIILISIFQLRRTVPTTYVRQVS